MLATDPSRKFVSEAIEYIRDPGASGRAASHQRFSDRLDELDRFWAQSQIDRLQWQLDFREKHDKEYVTPKLNEQSEKLHYHELELAIARQKIRAFERDIAALRGRLGDSDPSDLQHDNDLLRQENAALGLEVTRLKANRSRKDQQVKE